MATERTVIEYDLPLTAAAKVSALVVGKHTYTNITGSKPWQLALYADGYLVRTVSGSGAYTETPVLAAAFLTNAARTMRMKVTWYGEASMILEAGTSATFQVSYK